MDWIIGVVTCLALWFIARNRWIGWAIGLLGQLLWVWWIVFELQTWGLLVPAIALTCIYAREVLRRSLGTAPCATCGAAR